MAHYIRILLASCLLIGALWQLNRTRTSFSDTLTEEAIQADKEIRAYVMTQDIEYLRRSLIDLHKAHWELRKAEEREARFAFWCWVGIAGIALGLLLVAFRWRRP